MMPFSSRACPKFTPSSGLLISPLSISHDTNSLQTRRRKGSLKKKKKIDSFSITSIVCCALLKVVKLIWGFQLRLNFKTEEEIEECEANA